MYEKALQIAIDASRTTVPRRTGTENYALELLRHLLKLPSNHQYHFYFRDKPAPDLFPPAEQQSHMTPHIIRLQRVWTHLRFGGELWLKRPDVTFVPAHTLPRWFPGRAVVTVHDLGYHHFPDAHPEKERRYLEWSTEYSAKRATHILADSRATRDDLIQFYNVQSEKVTVIYPGVDERLHPVTDQEQLAAVRTKYGLPETFLLFLGTLQPRKNIERLVKAYARWRSESGRQDVGLVLAGKAGWLYQDAWTDGVEGVQLTGYVDDTDVAALYSAALGFVFPSLYEGFGFPVLEAMRCDTPAICSTLSSLPELAGDAAILVNPLNIQRIADGIARLVDDAALRQTLVQKGREQVQKFTWERAARETLTVLENTGYDR